MWQDWLFARPIGLAIALAVIGCTGGIAGGSEQEREADAAPGRPGRADAGGEPIPGADGSPTPARCDPARPFGPPVELPINSAAADAGLRLTPDELTGYFYSNRGGDGTRIYRTVRTDREAAFGPPVVLAEFAPSVDGPWSPGISPDGLSMVVVFNGGATGWDIYLTGRASPSAPFGGLVPVAAVNAPGDDLFPVLSPDGQRLYFKSARSGKGDLYVASRTGATFGPASPVALADSASFGEYNLALTPDELTMFFSRYTDATGLDVYVTTRPSIGAAFGPATVVPGLSTDVEDSPSWLSPDGCVLYLSSSRNGGDSDLFVATRPL